MTPQACDIIAAAEAYVRELFANEASGHDVYHTLRVTRTAALLAQSEGADEFTVRLAALLHDADDVKLFPDTAADKRHARDFMAAHGVNDATTETVVTIIDQVAFRGTDSVTPATPEGMCVQDADRLDALGAIGIARAFAYGGSHNRPLYDPDTPPNDHMTEAEYRASNSSSLNHFYEKLFRLPEMMNTAAARAEADRRVKLMREFVREFLEEWG